MPLEVTIRTVKETKDFLKEMPKMVRRGLVEGMQEVMDLTKEYAKDSLGKAGRPKNLTGTLRESIKSSVEIKGNLLTGKLSSAVIYARIQEEGGRITAKGSGFLKFQIGGQWISVKSVRIPRRPYLRPAIQDNLMKIEKLLTDSVFKEVERF